MNHRHSGIRVKFIVHGNPPEVFQPRERPLHNPALDGFQILVSFDEGIVVKYDVRDDILNIKDFKVLESEYGLFENVQLDSSRTCVFWNDRIDIASDTILEYGQPIQG